MHFKYSISIFALITLMLFSCGTKPQGSKAHQEAIKSSQKIEDFYTLSTKQIHEMKAKRSELLLKMQANESSDSTAQTNEITKEILTMNQSIAQGESISQQLKGMIEKHQKYIEKHENTALSVTDIQTQHIAIEQDFMNAEKQMALLKGLYDDLLSNHKKLMSLK